MNKFIKLACLTIVFTFSAHTMQNDADLGRQLVAAARAGDHKEIERLIEAGAPINYTESYGMTALMRAVNGTNLNCIKALIAAGAQVNMADTYGWTAVLFATKYQPQFLETLIAAGARVNHATYLGWTALKHAVFMVNRPICELLAERMLWIPNKAQKVQMLTLIGLIKFRKILCLPGLDANLRNELKTPCHAAVYEQNKNNFVNSIAYQEIAQLRESNTKKALLEKYNTQPTTSNSQSEG
jgi:ankyrin repeat protein